MTRFLYGAAHEQFPPDDLLRQAIEAEDAGFDGIACSDHFQPWWEPGESGMAWVWLGAVGQATRRVSLGSAVTPALSRYHPALVAQAWATLEVMFPGRTFLGIGSGESLNESPLGLDWPPPGVQLVAMTEALVAEEDGEVVGFVNVNFRPQLHHLAPVGTIDELVVDANRRGRRIGERLVEAVLEEARRRGADVVEVMTHERRERARAFYRRCGFETTSIKLVHPLR